MSLTLYQFPISHFCEKVRWALDFKSLDWRAENMLPGLHIRQARQLGRYSSVPILSDGTHHVQGSAQILDWLDEHYPQAPLTPQDPILRQQAMDWEKRLDQELGVHVRRFAYHTLLDHPQMVKPFFLHQGRWWWRPFLALTYPKLASTMRRFMAIDAAGAEQSRQQIETTLQALHHSYQQRPYLVGDAFSRADLAAAALLGPMIMPADYGLPWPEAMPDPLQGWADRHRQELAWVERLYRDHRHAGGDRAH